MNNQGQLIFDILLSVVILTIIIGLCVYILETDNTAYENNENEYNKPVTMLNLLKSTNYKEDNLLDTLANQMDENQNTTSILTTIESIISSNTMYDYTFSDLSENRTLINNQDGDYKRVYSARKMIQNHVFELEYYK